MSGELCCYGKVHDDCTCRAVREQVNLWSAHIVGLPPKGKARPRAVVRGGHAGIAPDKAYAKWQILAIQAVQAIGVPEVPFGARDKPLEVVVVGLRRRQKNRPSWMPRDWWVPGTRIIATCKPDLDNFEGAVWDVLVHAGVIAEDAYITSGDGSRLYWAAAGEREGILVTVRAHDWRGEV